MIVQISRDLGAFLYDVFVTRLDLWLVFGLCAQFLFAMRFMVQWIASERAGRSVIPVAFWFFSVAGGLLTLVYGIHRRDAVIILGQVLSLVIYGRNIMLIANARGRRPSDGAGREGPA